MPHEPARRPARCRRVGPTGLATCVVAALVGSSVALFGPSGAASASAALTFERYAGADRYTTAVAASAGTWADGSVGTVLLAGGGSTVDALAASYVAGAVGGPVLLTGRDELPAATLAELRRLGADNIVIAGGDAVVSRSVQQELETEFAVQRAAGTDRYDTAARLATLVPDADPEVVFVAGGAADAAAVGPIAAAQHWPVLLTAPTAASPAGLRALAAHPHARVVVVGGQSAVSATVAAAFGATQRISGDDRFETATEVAEFAVREAGFAATGFGLALGGGPRNDLADALTSGPVLARAQAPLLLAATPAELGSATRGYLEDAADRFGSTGYVFGGASAVSADAVSAAATAVGTTSSADVVLPPVAAVADYQLGGAYTPDPAVQVVTRDREDEPVAGVYSICYVNAFQTQPGEARFWLGQHRDLLVSSGGSVLEDPNWAGEYLLDTSTAAKREQLAAIVGEWIDGCAADGFAAVEPDNLDSWTRSGGELTEAGNLAFAKLLAQRAHDAELAIAQKNTAELSAAEVRAVGFDFAVTESCQVYDECGAYTDVYGDHVIEVEYTDDGRKYFTAACSARGGRISILLRDRKVVPREEAGYHYEWC